MVSQSIDRLIGSIFLFHVYPSHAPSVHPSIRPSVRPSVRAILKKPRTKNYRIIDYVRFVGSLRRTGYSGDVVLAVAAQMDERSKQFLMAMDVIAYPVAFNCSKGGSIKHSMECDWHPDQDMPLPLAVIRHELYLSWASLYSQRSRLLILDFRDTFFQRDPFESLPLGQHQVNAATGELEKYPFEQLVVLEHWPYKVSQPAASPLVN